MNSLLNDFNLRINDDIFIVKFDEQNMYAEIWEIYKISMDQGLILNGLGTWTEKDGLNMTTEEKYQRRSDLMVCTKILLLLGPLLNVSSEKLSAHYCPGLRFG